MEVSRTAIVSAKASVAWKTNFTDLKWDAWDPDVASVEDVQGGLANGSSLVLVMKDNGMRVKTVISDVRDSETFTFSGAIFLGLVSFSGTFLLEEGVDCSADQTKVTYTFALRGLLGVVASYFNAKAVIEGTENGLANVKKFSEEATG